MRLERKAHEYATKTWVWRNGNGVGHTNEVTRRSSPPANSASYPRCVGIRVPAKAQPQCCAAGKVTGGSGVTQAMRCRLCGISTYGLNGL